MSDGSFYQRDRSRHPPAFSPGYKTSVTRSPQMAPISLDNTISEMTGPVFGHGLIGELDNDLTRNFAHGGEPVGQRIIVHGRVLDEDGRPVPEVLLEFWQANAGGRYRHRKETYLAPLDPNFGGCGRTLTDENGNGGGPAEGSHKTTLIIFQVSYATVLFLVTIGSAIFRIRYATRCCSQSMMNLTNVAAAGMFVEAATRIWTAAVLIRTDDDETKIVA